MPGAGTLPWPSKRKTFSTASMQALMLSIFSSSLRRSSKVPSAIIRRSHQIGYLISAHGFDRLFPASKNSGAIRSSEPDRPILDPDPRAFAHPKDRRLVFLEKLEDALLLGFSHMRRGR